MIERIASILKMTTPNVSDDPQAPLLAGERRDDDEQQARGRFIIFKREFTLTQLISVAVGILALIAIGISIAAIGSSPT